MQGKRSLEGQRPNIPVTEVPRPEPSGTEPPLRPSDPSGGRPAAPDVRPACDRSAPTGAAAQPGAPRLLDPARRSPRRRRHAGRPLQGARTPLCPQPRPPRQPRRRPLTGCRRGPRPGATWWKGARRGERPPPRRPGPPGGAVPVGTTAPTSKRRQAEPESSATSIRTPVPDNSLAASPGPRPVSRDTTRKLARSTTLASSAARTAQGGVRSRASRVSRGTAAVMSITIGPRATGAAARGGRLAGRGRTVPHPHTSEYALTDEKWISSSLRYARVTATGRSYSSMWRWSRSRTAAPTGTSSTSAMPSSTVTGQNSATE